MKTQPPIEFNQKALIDIAQYFEFNTDASEPVLKKIDYEDFESIGHDLTVLLDAIEFIGYNGNKSQSGLCSGLAIIARKILPLDELRFLDSLLIKKDNGQTTFRKIEDLNSGS